MNCVEVVRLRRFKLNSMFENISRTKRLNRISEKNKYTFGTSYRLHCQQLILLIRNNRC